MKTPKRGRLSLAVGGSLLMPLVAQALPFHVGPVKGNFDSTISLGTALRVEDADRSLIGIANGGLERSVNDDDGNLAFKKGDFVSGTAKVTHDLDLKWNDYGLFTRASYFYDQIASDADHREDRLNANRLATRDRPANSYELGKKGRERLAAKIDLLDLFAYGNFNLGGHVLTSRIGKQVVSWGESTFIGNSINSINPVDVSKLRTPGAEVKEALIPIPMLWSSFQLTKELTLEGLVMAGYESTRLDPRGSFFSTNDFVSDDGDKAVVSFGRRKDDNRTATFVAPTMGPGQPPITIPADPAAIAYVPRQSSPKVSDAIEQYGLALRYFQDSTSTEYGLYFLNYHSRTPLVSAIRGSATNALATSQAAPTCAQIVQANCRATFYSEYPGNIQLYGLSFNTTAGGGVAVQGEYSYRPQQPIQVGGTEVLLASLGVPSSISPTPLPRGTVVTGYRRVEMHQAQVTLTKAFGPTFGAEQFATVAEFGITHFNNLPKGVFFGGPGAGLPACGFASTATLTAVSNNSCQTQGYLSKNSYGYRIVNRMDFENVIGALQMSPRVVWSHDVRGVGPSFNQDAKAITAGLAFNYLQRWQGDIGYTTFFGGRTYQGTDSAAGPGDPTVSRQYATSANPNKDKDFLAVSVSLAF